MYVHEFNLILFMPEVKKDKEVLFRKIILYYNICLYVTRKIKLHLLYLMADENVYKGHSKFLAIIYLIWLRFVLKASCWKYLN